MHWWLGLGLERAGAGRGRRLDTCLRSTLTHSIVRQRFLSHTGRDHLDPEEKQALKRLVEEELLKMQVWALSPRHGTPGCCQGVVTGGGLWQNTASIHFALLMHKQVDESGAREEGLDFAKEARRPPTPCKDPERKRLRLNSESG